MRIGKIFLLILLLAGAWTLPAVEERVQGNFFVRFPNRFDETAQVVEEMRLLERSVRLLGRFDGAGSDREFLVVLDGALAPEERRWESSGKRLILHVSSDWRRSLERNQPGRDLVTGLIRSRIIPDPGADAARWPGWIAAGLWADFQARRQYSFQMVRLVWLPLLRKAVASGGTTGVSAVTLQDGMGTLGAAAEALYLERAQLMLAVSARLSAGRQNLLADYLELGRRRGMTQEKCFREIFEAAALRRAGKMLKELAPEEDPPTAAEALERHMANELFSPYAPLPGDALLHRLQAVGKVVYRREENGPTAEAALEDLPRLVERYAACAELPRRKIAALNRLAAATSGEVREHIFGLMAILAALPGDPEKAEAEIRARWQALLECARWQEAVELFLDEYETRRLPPLYDYRLFLDAEARRSVLPRRLGKMMENAEQ